MIAPHAPSHQWRTGSLPASKTSAFPMMPSATLPLEDTASENGMTDDGSSLKSRTVLPLRASTTRTRRESWIAT